MTSRQPTASAEARPAYRRDLDGLRAVAILIVVAFHTDFHPLEGGFVGVDVFFVLSGWLITRQLWNSGDRVGLLSFWARRLRRLVPALTVMSIVTVVAALFVLSPREWGEMVRSGVTSVFYLSNFQFARNTGDYFASDVRSSVFLHTWSLGVEEQFYLVWPLPFAAAAALAARRRSIDRRQLIKGLLLIIFVVSFVGSLYLTRSHPTWAFYLLPSRAWEFAAGGLTAIYLSEHRWTRPVGTWMSALGVAGLALAVALFGPTTSFPGYAATLPVAATVLMILAGQADNTLLSRALTLGPVRALGRLSYSWYLWHWPAMVLATAWWDDPNPAVRAIAGVLSIGPAALSLKFVEDPIRRRPAWIPNDARTYAAAAVATIVALGVLGGVELYGRRLADQEPYKSLRAAEVSFISTTCDRDPFDGRYCEGGDVRSDVTVMLVGDSHAEQWFEAFSAVGERERIRIVLRSTSACPTVGPADGNDYGHGTLKFCPPFQGATKSVIEEVDPDAIVLADARSSRDTVFENDIDMWAQQFRAELADLRAEGHRVGVIVDNPETGQPLRCLARGNSEDECQVYTQDALGDAKRYREAESEAYGTGSDRLPALDVNDDICNATVCPLRQNGEWALAQLDHLTRAFTESKSAEITAFLTTLTDRSAP